MRRRDQNYFQIYTCYLFYVTRCIDVRTKCVKRMKVPDSKSLKSRCTFNVLYAIVCYVLLFIAVYYKIWNIDRRLSILWKLPILSELTIKLRRRNSLKNRSMFEVFRFYAACAYTYICAYSERIAMVLSLDADWYFNLRLDYIVSIERLCTASERNPYEKSVFTAWDRKSITLKRLVSVPPQAMNMFDTYLPQ